MKTKFQALAAVVLFAAMSNVASANEPSRVNAILGNEVPIGSVYATTCSNMVLPVDALTTNDNNQAGQDVTDNIDNTASYHHHGGGGGGGAIEGKNVIYAGVGFIGGLSLIGTLYKAEGYTATSVPTITLAYERGLSEHWGVGFIFDYSSVTLNATGTIDNTFGDAGPYNVGQTYNYTDKFKLTGLAFGVTGAYHFSASEKVDPYVGAALGYTSIGASFSTNDPNSATDQYFNSGATVVIKGSGVMFGGFLGIRLYFTDNIGAWADIGYLGYGGSLLNLGLAVKL